MTRVTCLRFAKKKNKKMMIRSQTAINDKGQRSMAVNGDARIRSGMAHGQNTRKIKNLIKRGSAANKKFLLMLTHLSASHPGLDRT